MGIARTFTKNLVYQVGTNVAIKLANLFLVVYLTRLLVPSDFGLYSWIISIALLADVFADFGAAPTMIRFINSALGNKRKEKAASFFRFSIRLKAIASAAVFLFMMIFADAIALFAFGKPFLAFPIRLSAILMLAYTFSSFLQFFFIAIQRNEYVFFANLVQAASKIALIVGLVVLLGSFVGAIIGYVLALILTISFFAIIFVKKYSFMLYLHGNAQGRRLFRFASLSALNSFALIIFANIDILMISALLPIENVGFYSIAMSWASTIGAFVPLFLFYPVFSELASMPKEHLREGFRHFLKYVLFLLIPASILLVFFSGHIISLFYSGPYKEAASGILEILALLVFFNGIVSVFMNFLSSIEHPEVNAKIFCIGVAMDLVLNYFWISQYGVIGAAYATVASYAAMFALYIFVVSRSGRAELEWKSFAKPVFASAIMACAVLLMDFPKTLAFGIAELAAAIAVYLAVQFAIKGITFGEIIFLKNRILKK